MLLNETPVRTSKNFKANDIEIEEFEVPKINDKFLNRTIYINSEKKTLLVNESFEDSERLNDLYEDSKILVSEITKSDFNFKYGTHEELIKECIDNSNQPLRVVGKEESNGSEANIEFLFDDDNKSLQDKIEIYAEKNASINVIINYIPKSLNEEYLSLDSNDNEERNKIIDLSKSNEYFYHNGLIKICGLENSEINVTIVNLLNNTSDNFLSIDTKLLENAKLNITIVDFGGKHSVTNYFCDLFGKYSDNSLNTIYLGNENQIFDMNYIAHCRGEKTNVNIEVQGALKDNALKHFKGTIDFKKGCRKSIGNENENCLLLSDTAKSLALPMLLCSEEDVEGNHSSSSGKAGKAELFYLMSRGFSEKEAQKLLVRAKFNKILEGISNKEVEDFILTVIESKL